MLVSNNISNLIGKSYSYKTNMQVHFGMNNPKNMLKPKYIPNAVWNAEQELLKNPNQNEAWHNLSDSIIHKYIKGNRQLMPIIDYIANNILLNPELSVKQKILNINESFRLYKKFLANNRSKPVNNYNPIDMTTILKVVLSEINCKDIKFEGLENIENGHLGDKVLSTYHSLAELIKFAQAQCDNKDIQIKFERPKALYTTITYKGSDIKNKDLKKMLPKTYYYSAACFEENNININKKGNYTSIKVKMYTLDELFTNT